MILFVRILQTLMILSSRTALIVLQWNQRCQKVVWTIVNPGYVPESYEIILSSYIM